LNFFARKIKNKKMQMDLWGKDIQNEEIQLMDMIGEGMYGRVFTAMCRAIKVAVKIPNRQELSRSEIATFKREIDIMRKITHPNVCLFMGAVADSSNIKIVTELLSGDVEQLIFNPSHPASLLQRLKWAKDAAQGMAWLHANNPCVLHRDLKPSNLLIDAHGTVKVTDFGLSDLIQQGAQVREVKPKGSPIYMAPEVMLRSNLTTKVDVYSFGVVLWEIIQREPAFSHHNDYGKFSKAVIDGERPPTKGVKPQELIDLMASCWSANPNERPDFPAICAALDNVMLASGIPGESSPHPARNFWNKNFNGIIQIKWNDFVKRLLKSFGQSYPTLSPEDVELPPNPSDEQISDASDESKKEFARRSVNNFRNIYTMYGETLCDERDYKQLSLKLLFINGQDEDVHLDFFGKVVGWLGPFGAEMLERYYKMVKSPWFHGNLSKTEAEERLKNNKEGTFLVRFSTSNDNNFVISKIGAEKSLKHMLVLYKPSEGYVFNKKTFPSFEELLKDSEKTFHLQHACDGSIFAIMKTPINPYEST
jgi:serine/threonine protein kinase